MVSLRLTGDAVRDVDAVAAWLAADDADDGAGDDAGPVVVATSGSSGAPKQVVLSQRAVRASAEASAARLGSAGPWLLALPSSYVAGLNVVARSLLAGHRPALLDGATLAERLPEGGFVSLVPTQLHRALDVAADLAALRRCHTVLIGGGPVDPSLRRRSVEAGVRVVATYGMAETCGGCVYDGLPLDGVGVTVGQPDGRVRLSGPTLFDGYLDDPVATNASLVNGWFVTADSGRLDDDGRLQVLGRLDDMVLSGGVNVPGATVAARLREHPSLDAAEVVGVPDAEWGRRVVAVVVGDLGLDDARDWVSAVHPRSWAPREVVRVAEMPMLGNGKVDRLRVREAAVQR